MYGQRPTIPYPIIEREAFAFPQSTATDFGQIFNKTNKMAYGVNEVARGHRNESCCKKRTCMERCEIVLLPIAVLIIAGLVVVLLFVIHRTKVDRPSYTPESKPEVCTTPDCVKSAATILKYIDESVDPCDNFYQFVCGGFMKSMAIPDDKPQLSPFVTTGNMVQQQLRTIIEEPPKQNEARPSMLLKRLYNICMNSTAIERDSLTTFNKILKDLGGWPVIEGKEWNEKDFEWQKSIVKFRKHGLSIHNFISFTIQPDFKNSSRNVMTLDQPDWEMSRETLLNGFEDPVVKAYLEYMVNVSVLLGADRDFAKYEMTTMLNFRIQLANISIPQEDRRNDTAMYNPMSIKQMQEKWPSVSWLELLNGVINLPGKDLRENDTVIVAVPEYINGLLKLLPVTSKRVQANHIICQTVRYIDTLLPESIRKLEQKFAGVIYGSEARPPRWDECVSVASGAFSLAAGASYIRRYFDEDSKRVAQEMVSDIRRTFVKTLREIDWMDRVTKEKAIEKVLAMTTHIAYADELLDDKKLEDYYSSLNVDTDNYIYFMANVSAFKTDYSMRRVCAPVNKTDWTQRATPITINAYYSLNENSIQFPAAILQGIFFNKNRLRAMNYGGIGTIIGHEITHGFDDEGKQYDKDGNLNDWWAENTNEAFMKKAQCIINQYSNYVVPEVKLKLNGVLTQGENIADNGGIKQAYLAYNDWVEANGEEPQLPGLNYTAKQTFWITTGSIWCTKDRIQSLKQDVLTDNHVPAAYRIIVPFSNSEYFSKDFNCPLGSKMNPRHKCQVW